MQRPKINLKLTDTVKKAREELIVKMKQDERVLAFLENHELSLNLVEDFPQMFADWIHELDECKRCPGLEQCVKVNKGEYYDLFYDGFLQKQLVACDYKLEEQERLRYLSNYVYRDFPDDIADITIDRIDYNNESDSYIFVVGSLIRWLEKPTSKGYYLHGDVGVGKTFLTAIICNELALVDKKISFVHLPSFATKMRGLVKDNREFNRVMSRMKHCDVLVLDDIGAETVTDWFRDDVLLSILNYRMESKQPVFYTSNLSYQELEAHYTFNNRNERNELAAERIMERVKVTSIPLEITGENRRDILK